MSLSGLRLKRVVTLTESNSNNKRIGYTLQYKVKHTFQPGSTENIDLFKRWLDVPVVDENGELLADQLLEGGILLGEQEHEKKSI